MRSGAVTNRTYRAWGNIELPKYFIKLHLGCKENRTYAILTIARSVKWKCSKKRRRFLDTG